MAERTFRMALEREPEDIVVMENLVPVLAALGKTAESQALAKRVASIEPNPPFHYFNLGMKAMERQRLQGRQAAVRARSETRAVLRRVPLLAGDRLPAAG